MMRQWAVGSVAVVAAGVLMGSISCSTSSQQDSCVGGQVRPCTCADGATGVQRCYQNGPMWEVCDCSGAGTTGGVGGGTTGVCTPGMEADCQCPNGPGRQTCSPDGFWNECVCIGTATGGSGGGTVGNTGGTVSNTGGTVSNTGGTVSNTGGMVSNTGGTVSNTGGTVSNTGGTTGNTGGTTSTGCDAEANYPNLVNETGWIGCDDASADDNPAGIQGSIYAYGDGVACDPPDGNPCDSSGCCVAGETIEDSSYEAWGCGIGIELNATGGDSSRKNAYQGDATCFDIQLSGSSGGQSVHFMVTQSASDESAPFVDIGAVSGSYSGTLCFTDVECPTWASSCEVGSNYYDIQIQVAGGEGAGTVDLCVTSLIPNTMQ
jgi:hypothetical protein